MNHPRILCALKCCARCTPILCSQRRKLGGGASPITDLKCTLFCSIGPCARLVLPTRTRPLSHLGCALKCCFRREENKRWRFWYNALVLDRIRPSFLVRSRHYSIQERKSAGARWPRPHSLVQGDVEPSFASSFAFAPAMNRCSSMTNRSWVASPIRSTSSHAST